MFDGVAPTPVLDIAWERAHPPKTPNEGSRRLVPWLRNLPETHRWDFARPGGEIHCGSQGCAMGLAAWLWGKRCGYESYIMGGTTERAFTLPDRARFDNGVCPEYGVPASAVTPAMVADYIEELLAE